MEGSQFGREEMNRLAAYLRQHPAAFSLPVEQVAKEANVSVDSVRAVMSTKAADRKGPKRTVKRRGERLGLGSMISQVLDRLFKYPIAVVIVTLVLAFSVQLFLDTGTSGAVTTRDGMRITAEDEAQIGAIVAMGCVQLLCFYWRARARFAIYGALIVGGATFAGSMVVLFARGPLREQPWLALISAFGIGLLTGLYGLLGVGLASLGGYVRYRREESSVRRLSRQDLLERLFVLEELLREPEEPAVKARFPWLDGVRRRVFLYAAGLGFVVTLLLSLCTMLAPPMNLGGSGVPYFVVQITFAFISLACQVGLAYLGGAPLRSTLISLTFSLASTAAVLVPVGPIHSMWLSRWTTELITGTLGSLMIGVFAGLGAYVESKAYLARRRQANDPSVLLAEYVEIQRMLNPATRSKCVLVVDAASSSLMKAHADPLVAEWSFRAYQEFIAGVIEECGGQIHSTAGDGAMAAFDDAHAAFLAARTIQSRIADFNAHVSRLKDPFRLRIGIHCGEVSGDLDEVEFTAVLDIAAHIEAVSQVGGIAVTGSVVEQLEGHRFVGLPELIDEQRVFLAMNPTLDP